MQQFLQLIELIIEQTRPNIHWFQFENLLLIFVLYWIPFGLGLLVAQNRHNLGHHLGLWKFLCSLTLNKLNNKFIGRKKKTTLNQPTCQGEGPSCQRYSTWMSGGDL